MKKIVIACDSFKESMTALEACIGVEQGIKEVAPTLETVILPLADGGEGSGEVLASAMGLSPVTIRVQSPLHQMIESNYYGKDTTAVIEVASCLGIGLTPLEYRDPTKMTSYGFGQMIDHAITSGKKHIIVCLGGSGTSDGGFGMLHALGAKFYDAKNQLLENKVENILKIVDVDFTTIYQKLEGITIEVASDVENTYVGPLGATNVFSKQKGATPAMQEVLEASLVNLASVINAKYQIDISNLPRTGAAGGISGVLHVLGASLTSGIETILKNVRFEEIIQDASLIITGEGSVDSQTIHGKTISGIAHVARKYNIPVVVLAGRVTSDAQNLYEIGVTAMISICNEAKPLAQALVDGKEAIVHTTKNVIRLLKI